jgi:nitrate/TMAO reductase-like tetraheme cytochrome c subunit
MTGDSQPSNQTEGGGPQQETAKAPGLSRNPISLLGTLAALVGLAGLSYVFGLQFLGVTPSPYVGVLAYLLFPGVLTVGLLIIPFGMAWEARRRAAAARRGEASPPAFRIDLGNPHHVRGVFLFGVSTAIIVGALGAAGYRGVEFTDSPTFCGELCHEVMEPQYEPYKRSPHAQVACATCHIGAGANWWVQSKLSGVKQLVAVALDTYPRPIPAPIEHLRPARETCEECHWRERTYGLRLKEYRQYLPDKFNTLERSALAFRVGTGGDEPAGVHWHTAAELWYRAADKERQVIGWAAVEGADGTREWINPTVSQDELGEPRLMDCIDCHNRTAHDIPSPEELIDEGLASGRLDTSLPYLKREALSLLFAEDPNPDAAALAATWQDGWFDQLQGFYEENYPDVAVAQAEEIQQAIDELKSITQQVIYPDMNTTWRTYPDNGGHVSPEQPEAGCFRCHDSLASADTKEMLPSPRCQFCHYDVQPEEIEESGDRSAR